MYVRFVTGHACVQRQLLYSRLQTTTQFNSQACVSNSRSLSGYQCFFFVNTYRATYHAVVIFSFYCISFRDSKRRTIQNKSILWFLATHFASLKLYMGQGVQFWPIYHLRHREAFGRSRKLFFFFKKDTTRLFIYEKNTDLIRQKLSILQYLLA